MGMIVINPYADVNWATVGRIMSTSHAHGRSQKSLNYGVAGGLTHIAYSNYYPSEPFYPLEDFFETVPPGLIGSPNAEHHGFGVNLCHLNGLGCTLITGNPKGTSPVGMATIGVHSWKDAISALLNTLMFEDSGGVTINHPTYTKLTKDLAINMLDYDNRVLGIEIVNSAGEYEDIAYSYEIWDEILTEGRRCWGFCVPDHGCEKSPNWSGRNILLTDDATNHGCLKAYRDGRFFSKIYNSDLTFDYITVTDSSIDVSATGADKIIIVADGGKTEYDSDSVSVQMPENAKVYVRIEAWKNDYEWTDYSDVQRIVTDKIFSNPIMLTTADKNKSFGHSVTKKYDL